MTIDEETKTFLRDHIVGIDRVISEEGEVLEEDIKVVSHMAGDKEEFFLAFTSMLGALNKLSLGAVRVYAYLLQRYNSGTDFEIGAASRNLIADYCKISTSNVAASLGELREKGLLYSRSRSLYMINPRYAFQGSKRDRDKKLMAIIKLGCKDC